MVREANTRQATAERLLEESRMKVEVLAAEVIALKTLVLTSTPARPNPHLHPQIDTRSRSNNTDDSSSQGGLFTKKHRRSPTNLNNKYSPPESPQKEQKLFEKNGVINDKNSMEQIIRDKNCDRDDASEHDKDKDKDNKDFGIEIDPKLHMEFLRWKENPCIDMNNQFILRIFHEDIDLCLDFPNIDLGIKVRQALLDGIIFIEAISDKKKTSFPK